MDGPVIEINIVNFIVETVTTSYKRLDRHT